MALIRGHHNFDDHFTQIPNDWVRDDRLSLEARGLLAQIMSHKPGWNLSIRSLAARNNVGRDKMKRIIDELLTFGYLARSEAQGHNERGHLAGFDYTTCDPGGLTQKPYKAEPYKVEPAKADRPTKNIIPKEEQLKKKKHIIRAEDFVLSDQLRENMEATYPALVLDDEVTAFIDHHTAKGSTFKDWNAAFRTWCRNANKWGPQSRKTRQQQIADENKRVLGKFLEGGN